MAFFREWILWMFRVLGAIGIILGLLIFFSTSPTIDLYDTLKENNTLDQTIYSNFNLTNDSKLYNDSIMENFCLEKNQAVFCNLTEKTNNIITSPTQNIVNKFSPAYDILTFLRTLSIILWVIGTMFVFSGLKFDWRKLLVHLGIKNGIPLALISYIFYWFNNITPEKLASHIPQNLPFFFPDQILNMIATELLTLIQQTIEPYFTISLTASTICMIAIISGYICRLLHRKKLKANLH